ncbi:MAG: LuxR C-terminal-related transcriptional regulator, partial [Solirubrobacterales bacterium]
ADAAQLGEQLIVLDGDERVTALVGDPAAVLGELGTSLAPGELLPAELAQLISNRADRARGRYAAQFHSSVETGGQRVSVRSFVGEFPDANRILEIKLEQEALGPDLAAELQITPREAEVANLLARGLSDPLIAECLAISPHTVKRHVEQIYAKLGVGSRWEALARLLVPIPPSDDPR